jgi:acylphosphatase
MTSANRLHVRIAGRVQGVGFRWFVREEARRLNLSGWVRNLPSGEVEVCAEGEVASIENLAGAIAKGPPGARVELVHRVEEQSGGTLPSPFTIER